MTRNGSHLLAHLWPTAGRRRRQSTPVCCRRYTSAANLTCSTTGLPYKCVPRPQQPACSPYGHPRYWGHYLGHYLSATAMAYENAGRNETIRQRGAGIVAALARVETANARMGEPGFVYPYDMRSFQNLFDKAPDTPGGDGGGNCQPVCVPFYVMHKVLAGLLDQHQRAGNAQALMVALKMADWTARHVEATIARYGMAKWQGVLDTEWGGMNDALLLLYSISRNATHMKTASRFNHFQWTAPLAAGLDALDGSHGNDGGNHANTHIPEIVGSARGYELTGNATQHAIVSNFFNILTAGEGEEWDPASPGGHTWATGGSNDQEHWCEPIIHRCPLPLPEPRFAPLTSVR